MAAQKLSQLTTGRQEAIGSSIIIALMMLNCFVASHDTRHHHLDGEYEDDRSEHHHHHNSHHYRHHGDHHDRKKRDTGVFISVRPFNFDNSLTVSSTAQQAAEQLLLFQNNTLKKDTNEKALILSGQNSQPVAVVLAGQAATTTNSNLKTNKYTKRNKPVNTKWVQSTDNLSPQYSELKRIACGLDKINLVQLTMIQALIVTGTNLPPSQNPVIQCNKERSKQATGLEKSIETMGLKDFNLEKVKELCNYPEKWMNFEHCILSKLRNDDDYSTYQDTLRKAISILDISKNNKDISTNKQQQQLSTTTTTTTTLNDDNNGLKRLISKKVVTTSIQV